MDPTATKSSKSQERLASFVSRFTGSRDNADTKENSASPQTESKLRIRWSVWSSGTGENICSEWGIAVDEPLQSYVNRGRVREWLAGSMLSEKTHAKENETHEDYLRRVMGEVVRQLTAQRVPEPLSSRVEIKYLSRPSGFLPSRSSRDEWFAFTEDCEAQKYLAD